MADRLMEESNHPLLEAVEPMEAEVPSIQETGISGATAEDEYNGYYEWKIENFSRIGEKMYSEKFEIGTYIWRLLAYPKGNNYLSGAHNLSVYLDAPEAQYTPINMSPRAAFTLTLINQVDPTKNFSKDSTHTFTSQSVDWGFTTYMPLDDILNPNNGFIMDDSITLRVEIHVQKDELYAYDSRKETGYVGLKNQGATCYMNSLLQYLYNIPYFRKAVYHMPTLESDEACKCLPLALQSVFYKLQYSKTSVSTKDLTKSFGWGTYDAFLQHDVQELNRVLCEKLEAKMKGTTVEKVITDLFEGHTYSFIECMNVEYKSTRKESFMDLQLDVKGCKNIYESFTKYCEVETMDGPNQYKAEGHGLQDAKKGVLFENFPPVLQLQLKRFEYDFQRDTMVKINDRYEFPESLDLDFNNGDWLSPNSDRGVRNLYRLHSVLVHSGGVHGGHYYAYIRPDGKQWLKFDDERVTLEDEKIAMDDQYGGDDNDPSEPGYNANTVKYARFSNAYMLVYVRTSEWDKICGNVTKNDLSEHLRHRFEQEQREKEMRQKEKQEAHLFCTLKVATDDDMLAYVGKKGQYFDLVAHDQLTPEHIFRVRKNVLFTDFKAMVAEKVGVPPEQQRYWTWERRSNGTFRPKRALRADEENVPMVDLREHRETGPGASVSKHAIMDLKLFLEVPQTFDNKTCRFQLAQGLMEPKLPEELLVFIKRYDPETEELRYVGRPFLPAASRLQDLAPFITHICGMPDGSSIDVYEELDLDPSIVVEKLDMKKTLAELQLSDGDIIILQEAVAEGDPKFRHPSVSSFLQYVCNRRLVNFRKLEEPSEAGFVIEMLRDMSYDEVTEALALKLGLSQPTKLRLTQHNAFSHQPQRAPIKHRGICKLELMLQHANHVNEVLYYEVLDIPLPELEQLKILRVAYHNERAELKSEYTVRLPKDSTVADVLAEVQTTMGSSTDSTVLAAAAKLKSGEQVLRLMEVYNNKLYKVCEASESTETMNDAYWNLRAELVPVDQMPANVAEGHRIIHVNHFNMDKENSQVVNFGDPFLLRISDTETVAAIKPRIQAMLGTSDDEFAKWEFAFVEDRSPEYLAADDVLGARFAKAPLSNSEINYLGLQHEDKGHRRANNYRSTYEQRAVKIFS